MVTLVLGTYWIAVVQPERAGEERVRQRLLEPRAAAPAREIIVADVDRLSTVPLFNRLLEGQTQLVAPLKTLIQHAGIRVTVGTVLLSSALSAAVGLLVGQWLLGSAWGGLIVACLTGPVPILVLQWKRDQRIAKFEALFPEAVDLLSRSLRAGHAFTTGLGMVAEEMPPPIGAEFRLLFDRQNFGLPLPDALREFAERVPLLDARFFVTAVLTQRESGGNLSEVLDNLSTVIRDRFSLKRQVRAKSAHGRVTGWILAAMPPALALAFMVISPSYIGTLMNDPIGIRLLLVAIVLQVIGTVAIRRIVRIEY
ncbi:MAG: type II secretion system F family protein [Acidobacteria bacterium]|nr:type II secretion system F family protein [Acidobacteriota bacterium]